MCDSVLIRLYSPKKGWAVVCWHLAWQSHKLLRAWKLSIDQERLPSTVMWKRNQLLLYLIYVFFIYFLPFVFQSLSCVLLFVTPWTAAYQASVSFSSSWRLLKFMSIESVMLSNQLILRKIKMFPCTPALSFSQHQGLFQWVGSSHQVAKILEFQLQYKSFQWIVRVDFL